MEPAAAEELASAFLVLEIALAEMSLEAYLTLDTLGHRIQVVVEDGKFHAFYGQTDGCVFGGFSNNGENNRSHRLTQAIAVIYDIVRLFAAHHPIATCADDTNRWGCAAIEGEDCSTDESAGDTILTMILGHACNILVYLYRKNVDFCSID